MIDSMVHQEHGPGSSSGAGARHLVHVFPGFAVGGSQSRFLQLVEGACDRYRHTVLSLNGSMEMAARIPSEFPVKVFRPVIGKTSGPANWLRCRSHLRQLRPDLLVTYNWGAMDWCLSNRIAPLAPHVHIEDGFGPEEMERQFQRRIWGRRIALTGANSTIVVPSQRLAKLARTSWNIANDRLRYVPNGVDCRRFRPRLQRDPGPLVIGTIATLRREKNLGRLIRLFSVLASRRPDVRLVIVGEGAERRQLERLAAQCGHGDRIDFTGASATPEKALGGFDIFALSSDTEQMPLSVLEAMASGLPVISFAVGDVPQMVAEENRPCASLALSDDSAYVRQLEALADSDDLRRRLGMANRQRAETAFDQTLMLERYFELFG